MKLINSKNNKSLIFLNAQSPCAIILINPKDPYIYLLMGFNDYLGPLVNVEGVTSISTISLVDVDVGSFSPYIYLSTPWTKHTKATVRGAPSLENPSCSKLDLFLLLLPSPPPPRCSARSSSPSCNKSSPPLRSCCCHGRVVAVWEAKG